MAETLDYAKAGSVPATPLAELLALAVPTVAQMASYTVMQFIDTWMLAHYADGVLAPTAAANSGILAFAVISLGMGALWVVNTLVSQAFGRGDFAACGRYLWQGVWFGVAFAVVILPVLPFVQKLFALAGHPADLIHQETQYIHIVLGASVLKLVGTAFGQFLLAVDRPRAVMMATVGGVAVNAVASWGLVFGHFAWSPLGVVWAAVGGGVVNAVASWGLVFGHFAWPPLGVVGAAWAQNIGVGVEMLLLIGFTVRRPIWLQFNVGAWSPRLAELRTLLVVGLPSGLQTVADVLAWSAFQMGVMGVFGTASMAANAFVFRYMSVSFMPAYGVSVAVTALVGRYIGRGRPDAALHRANLGFVVVGAYMLTCGLVFFVARWQLIGLFATDPEVKRVGAMLLIFAAVYQFFDAMYLTYNGALRGAGDTLVPAVVTGVMCWGITVFGGYGVAKYWAGLGPAGPWITATLYGILLGVFMLARFRRGGWRRIRLDATDRPDTVPGFDVVPVAPAPSGPLAPVLRGEG